MKRYGFLVTDGEVVNLYRSWGETMGEAKQYLAGSLNPFNSIVEDEKTIREFIEESETDLRLQPWENGMKLLKWFLEDLESLKKSIKEDVTC